MYSILISATSTTASIIDWLKASTNSAAVWCLRIQGLESSFTWHIQLCICPHKWCHKLSYKIGPFLWYIHFHKPKTILPIFLLPFLPVYKQSLVWKCISSLFHLLYHQSLLDGTWINYLMPWLVIFGWTIPYWLEQCHRPWHSGLSASQCRGSYCHWSQRPLSPCHQTENWGCPAHGTGKSDKAGVMYLIKSLCQSALRSVKLLMSDMKPDLQVNKGLDNETMWQTLCRKPTVVITRVNTSSSIFFMTI